MAQLFNSCQKVFEIGPRVDKFSPGSTFSGGFVVFGDGNFGPMSWRDFVNEFYYDRERWMRSDDDIPQQVLEFAQRKWQQLQDSGKVPAGSDLPGGGAIIGAVSKGALIPHGAAVIWQQQSVSQLQQGNPLAGGDFTTVFRIIDGCDPLLRDELFVNGVDRTMFNACAGKYSLSGFASLMPIRDAIDYVHFLIYATIKMHRYRGIQALVGGPIEIAAITGDRGFRWILHKPLGESISAMRPHFLE